MIEEMKLRSFSPRTQKSYVAVVVELVKHYRRSPDQITQDEIRFYLLHLEERGLSANSQNVAISDTSALFPRAVLSLPVVFLKSASTPMAVLASPVVLFWSAPVPRLVLVCAAATPARESEKMSAAIRTEKKEAVLVEWLNI